MSYVSFLLAALLLAITPGPGIAYVVARTVAGGRAEGWASCLGAALGGLVHVLAAALGLSLLVAQSAWAFNGLKYAGAVYMVYLGVRLLTAHEAGAGAAPASGSQGATRALLEGIVVEALNIKTALFFLAFLPQFIRSDTPPTWQMIELGATCVALNTGVDVLAVFFAGRLLKASAARARRARAMRRLAGGGLIALGAVLATVRRSS